VKLNPKALKFEQERGELFRQIYLPLLIYPAAPLILLCAGHPAGALIWAIFARGELIG
jgi:hypothetical protein